MNLIVISLICSLAEVVINGTLIIKSPITQEWLQKSTINAKCQKTALIAAVHMQGRFGMKRWKNKTKQEKADTKSAIAILISLGAILLNILCWR